MNVKNVMASILSNSSVLKRVLRAFRKRMYLGTPISSQHVVLRQEERYAEGQRLRAAWQNEALPVRQRKLVEQQLRKYRTGTRIDVFDVLVKSLRALPDLASDMTLLEIGCSSGYYSEVLDIAGLPLKYAGCDYSPAFIQMAQEKYPGLQFSVQDATALHYPDSSFDIVVSGCCLLHIPEYKVAMAETARVCRYYAVFHRTPVVWGQPEQWYRKQAYGVETVEIHFNEPEFLALMDRSGLELIATYTLDESVQSGVGSASRTYVCRKKNQ